MVQNGSKLLRLLISSITVQNLNNEIVGINGTLLSKDYYIQVIS